MVAVPHCFFFDLWSLQYTLFANSSIRGTPPVRALFFEFPNERELFNVSTQFLVGRDILVTPVLAPNVTTVDGACKEPVYRASHGSSLTFP